MAVFKAYTQYNTNQINELKDPLVKTYVDGGVRATDPTGASILVQGSSVGIDAASGNLTGNPNAITQYASNGATYYTFSNLNANLNLDVYDSGYTVDGQTLHGFQAETAYWLRGNDTVTGSQFSDVLSGFAGKDTLEGLAGNDQLYGYSGTDTAVYSGNSSSYSVRASGATVSVQSSTEGADTLYNVELLQFSDKTVSIAQLAGQQDSNAVFRFFNSGSGTHFYTGSAAEADSVIRNLDGFTYEGVSFDKNPTHSSDAIGVSRFFNTDTGTHFYTASQQEANSVMANLPNYRYEGVAYEAHSTASAGTTELYRFFNKETGTHFYTANQAEMQNVKLNLSGTYNYEGVAYYVDVA